MSNKVKYIDIKNRTYYFFNDIIDIVKNQIIKQKYSCLLHWICDDQIFEIRKN